MADLTGSESVDQTTNQDREDVRDVIAILRAKRILLDLPPSVLVRQLPKHYGNDAAKVMYGQIIRHIAHGHEKLVEFQHRPYYMAAPVYKTRYTKDRLRLKSELQALATLPGGTALALSALVSHSLHVAAAHDGFEPFPYSRLEGLEGDDRARKFCRMLLERPEDEYNHGCEVVMKARKDGLKLKAQREACVRRSHRPPGLRPLPPPPGNPWLFKSMVLLAEDHSKRTSFLLVRKVVDGRLPEELIEMIREFYMEEKAERMTKLKKEYEEHWRESR